MLQRPAFRNTWGDNGDNAPEALKWNLRKDELLIVVEPCPACESDFLETPFF